MSCPHLIFASSKQLTDPISVFIALLDGKVDLSMNKKKNKTQQNLLVHGPPKYTKLALSHGSWAATWPHVVLWETQMNMLLK